MSPLPPTLAAERRPVAIDRMWPEELGLKAALRLVQKRTRELPGTMSQDSCSALLLVEVLQKQRKQLPVGMLPQRLGLVLILSRMGQEHQGELAALPSFRP